MRKKVFAAVIAVITAAALAGCGESTGEKTGEASTSVSSVSSDSSAAAVSSEVAKDSVSVLEEDLPIAQGDVKVSECLEMGDYAGLKLTRTVENITQSVVDETFNSLAVPEEIADEDAAAQLGDTVNISFYGYIDGETSDSLCSDSTDLELGSGSFIEGFEDGLVGLKKNEKKTLELKFPENYFSADVAGKDVSFDVTILAIKRIPVQDDEWVKNFTDGDFTTVADFKAHVKEVLTGQAEMDADSAVQSQVWDALYSLTEFKQLPAAFVEAGKEAYDANVMQYATVYGFETIEDYIEASGITPEDYEQYKLDYAKEAAKSKLMITYIWEKEGFTTEDAEYKEILEGLVGDYGMDEAALRESYGDNAVDDYCMSTRVINAVLDKAVVTTELAGE